MEFISLKSPERMEKLRALGKLQGTADALQEGIPAKTPASRFARPERPAGLDPRQVICLIDANKFYCACERVIDPSLRGKPLVVLTNNDGCVAALTPEAKALGIRRGMPAYQFRRLVKEGKVEWRSSNYELYGSVSKNIAAILSGMAVRIERYSIDENFVDITGIPGDPTALGRAMKERIYAWQRIPACVGIANTKTLAKLANHLAKDWPVFGGVINWLDLAPHRQEKAMSITPLKEVWGIGSRMGEALQALGIQTVLDFWKMDPLFIRARWGVVLERTWRELHGIPCIPFDEEAAPREQIIRSRSFGRPVTDLASLTAAVSQHMADAAMTLRQQKSAAGEAGVFFHTNFFRGDLPQHNVSRVVKLPIPTSDTLLLTRVAVGLVERFRREGFAYQKAGVILSGIAPEASAVIPETLFCDAPDPEKERRRALMETLDGLARIYGRGIVTTASTQLASGWEARHEKLSRCYLTRREEILRAH